MGTGNYNEDTVRLYTDYALMTASPEIGAEAAQVFNCLSMGEVVENSRHLMVAPACLRPPVVALIDREIAEARQGRPAYLGFKLNGLTDKLIIDKLVEASQAGVKIEMVVRGICCLIGGVSGLTENIQVHSIVGRYLEHARVYIFGQGDRKQIYISSADFMTRNTTRRVEVAVPVYDPKLREHLETMFQDQLRDTAKGRVQQPDGEYVRAEESSSPFNSQEHFCGQAYGGAWALERPEAPKPAPKPMVKPERAPAPPAKAAPKKQPAQVRKTHRGLLNRILGGRS